MQKSTTILWASCFLVSSPALYAEAISDNSFLVEEAFNQEAGVVQFIQTLEKAEDDFTSYSFTIEAPAPNLSHQIAITLPYAQFKSAGESIRGIGDAEVSYRYQLLHNEGVAAAASLSLLVPTGDEDQGLGNGSQGYETNWAVSVHIHPQLDLHTNVGATYYPDDKLHGQHSALSLVWLLAENFNLLVEFVGESMAEKVGDETQVLTSAVINPGLRYAFNFADSQLVLGASMPTPALYSTGKSSALFYLSYEPKLW